MNIEELLAALEEKETETADLRKRISEARHAVMNGLALAKGNAQLLEGSTQTTMAIGAKLRLILRGIDTAVAAFNELLPATGTPSPLDTPLNSSVRGRKLG